MGRLIGRLKMRYARFLFDKYGYGRGLFFENIPLIYRINPLFSPSCYYIVEGEQMMYWTSNNR